MGQLAALLDRGAWEENTFPYMTLNYTTARVKQAK